VVVRPNIECLRKHDNKKSWDVLMQELQKYSRKHLRQSRRRACLQEMLYHEKNLSARETNMTREGWEPLLARGYSREHLRRIDSRHMYKEGSMAKRIQSAAGSTSAGLTADVCVGRSSRRKEFKKQWSFRHVYGEVFIRQRERTE